MKHFFLGLFAAVGLAFGSCADHGAGPGGSVRVVFYPTATIDGAGVDQLGLWSICESGTTTRIIPGSAVFVTNVADGGVVIAEMQDTAQYTMQARCSNGTIVPVPQPVPSDVNRLFTLNLPPRVALAFDAHYAAYPAMNIPRIPTRDGSQSRLNLIRVSCADRTATPIDLHDSVVAAMRTQGASAARAWGNQILIDRTGTKIWIAVAGVHFPADAEEVVGYMIFGWENGTIMPVAPFSTSPYSLCAYDNIENCIIYRHENKLYSLVPGGKAKLLTLDAGSIVASSQAAVTKSRVAIFGSTGIELRNPLDGSLLGAVVPFTHAAFMGYDMQASSRSIGISPDGDAIVVALPKIDSPGRKGIFLLQSDGSFVKLLAADLACGSPVVSNVLPKSGNCSLPAL